MPSEIKKGLDRRSISYIVLLKESAATSEEEALLRQQVFERLNTGPSSSATRKFETASIRVSSTHCFDAGEKR